MRNPLNWLMGKAVEVTANQISKFADDIIGKLEKIDNATGRTHELKKAAGEKSIRLVVDGETFLTFADFKNAKKWVDNMAANC